MCGVWVWVMRVWCGECVGGECGYGVRIVWVWLVSVYVGGVGAVSGWCYSRRVWCVGGWYECACWCGDHVMSMNNVYG